MSGEWSAEEFVQQKYAELHPEHVVEENKDGSCVVSTTFTFAEQSKITEEMCMTLSTPQLEGLVGVISERIREIVGRFIAATGFKHNRVVRDVFMSGHETETHADSIEAFVSEYARTPEGEHLGSKLIRRKEQPEKLVDIEAESALFLAAIQETLKIQYTRYYQKPAALNYLPDYGCPGRKRS